MIRFILKRRVHLRGSGLKGEDFVTIDVAVPELEAMLKRGGHDDYSYDTTDLVGAELLPIEGIKP